VFTRRSVNSVEGGFPGLFMTKWTDAREGAKLFGIFFFLPQNVLTFSVEGAMWGMMMMMKKKDVLEPAMNFRDKSKIKTKGV
jgi:hypothetical protein